MRVPPYAWVDAPMAPPPGARFTWIAPAARYHCSILSCANAATLRLFSLYSAVIRITGKPSGSFTTGSRSRKLSSYGNVVFCRYDVLVRSAFFITNDFHSDPHDGVPPNVPMPAAEIGRRSDITHRLPPPM